MISHNSGEPLRGRRIVLTRPTGQNERLAQLIAAAGGETIAFPAIAILDAADAAPIAAAADRLHLYDFAVFVSPNAVAKALRAIQERRTWPANVRAVAVGPGSAQALAQHGVSNAIVPEERFDSEGLLDLPAFVDVAEKRIIVFRGEGGRDLLGETLHARGARVDYIACYRRAHPTADAKPLLDAWSRGEVDAVTITSSEGLRNLFDLVGEAGAASLRRTPVFAPHARIAATARALGCQRVVETPAGDDGIVAGLAGFWAKM
jgi:uroporphyrinogen-III synthase